jgi:hypothetical protein
VVDITLLDTQSAVSSPRRRPALSAAGGDLNRLRDAAGRDPAAVRAALKRLRGVGDGGVDIFFREAQLAWPALFPFADKKALKAARLVGLQAHPGALAALCGGDRGKFVRLCAALVRVETGKAWADFA